LPFRLNPKQLLPSKCKFKMSLIEEKNLKVTSFSRKQEDWKFWEIKFLAQARCKKFREILLGTIPISKDNERFDLTKPAEKVQSEICK